MESLKKQIRKKYSFALTSTWITWLALLSSTACGNWNKSQVGSWRELHGDPPTLAVTSAKLHIGDEEHILLREAEQGLQNVQQALDILNIIKYIDRAPYTMCNKLKIVEGAYRRLIDGRKTVLEVEGKLKKGIHARLMPHSYAERVDDMFQKANQLVWQLLEEQRVKMRQSGMRLYEARENLYTLLSSPYKTKRMFVEALKIVEAAKEEWEKVLAAQAAHKATNADACINELAEEYKFVYRSILEAYNYALNEQVEMLKGCAQAVKAKENTIATFLSVSSDITMEVVETIRTVLEEVQAECEKVNTIYTLIGEVIGSERSDVSGIYVCSLVAEIQNAYNTLKGLHEQALTCYKKDARVRSSIGKKRKATEYSFIEQGELIERPHKRQKGEKQPFG